MRCWWSSQIKSRSTKAQAPWISPSSSFCCTKRGNKNTFRMWQKELRSQNSYFRLMKKNVWQKQQQWKVNWLLLSRRESLPSSDNVLNQTLKFSVMLVRESKYQGKKIKCWRKVASRIFCIHGRFTVQPDITKHILPCWTAFKLYLYFQLNRLVCSS